MNVAREVFFEHGYSATSMSAIAARLGGSKGTLYNYFKSKEELFAAQVRDMCSPLAHRMVDATEAAASPREALITIGRDYLRHLFSEGSIKMFRILVAEAQRTPELAKLFYEVGPARGRKALEEFFAAARERGLLDVPDCALAAAQFLAICKGSTHLEFLLNLIPALTSEEIDKQVEQAVDAMMRLYGPKESAA
jgi:AcrR family transcriptional regulator